MSRRKSGSRTEFYDPQIMGKLEYANNPTRNRLRQIERFYITHLTQMAANRYNFIGLPKEIDQRYVKLCLVRNGLVVFFHEDKKYNQYMALRAGSIGPLNVYDSPTEFQVIGGSGSELFNEKLSSTECVPIWSNYLRMSEMPNIIMWANRLAEIDRTIEISAVNARQTRVVSVPEDQRLSAENTIKQMREGVETVFGSEALSNVIKSIETFDLEAHPVKLPNLLIAKGKIWNEIMTYMGVNNSNQDKKERLVAAEVGANDEQIDLTKAMVLSAIQEGCDQINEMFDLNVSVEFNQSMDVSLETGNQNAMANAVPNSRNPADWQG